MTCQHCQDNNGVYVWTCLGCCARHCLMQFYPPNMDKWDYVRRVAEMHKHDPKQLAMKVKEMKNGKAKTE